MVLHMLNFMVVTHMRKRIAFIETNPPNCRGNYTKCNNFEPYGLELLAADAKQEGFGVKLFQQNEMPDEDFTKKVLSDSPDILAFSCMTFNYDSSLAISRLAKRQNPSVKVILGGPHISSFPHGLKTPIKEGLVDYGIKGEADNSFRSLIANIDTPDLSLDGLIYLGHNEFVINPAGKRITSLDNLPFALRDSKIFKRTKIGRIMEPAQSDQVGTATISYSRGCPFSCSYCDSKNIWGNNVVWRSASNVVNEIEQLKQNYGTNTIFFADLTFNTNPEKIRELSEEMIRKRTEVRWYVLARAATPDGERPLIDRNLLALMYEAGCRKIGYGLESVIPEVQREFRKTVPNGIITDLVGQGHELGILNKGFIILGDPKYESPETIKKTLEVLKRVGFDEIRTSFLTPFPGSELYLQARQNGDLLTEDFSRYTTDEPILRCQNLSTQELLKVRKQITEGYYKSEEYLDLVKSKISKFPQLAKPYEEHHQFLREKGIL